MLRQAYVGIDPGMSGGIAISNKKHEIFLAFQMPLASKEINYHEIRRILEDVSEKYELLGCVEKVSSMPNQGVASTFKFGFGTGCIHGILIGLGIPVHMVTPQAWQKFVLAGLSRGDKSVAIDYVARVYPNVNLFPTARSKKMSSGIADAVCIARYASFNL